MPELPEVEQFRKILLPLCGGGDGGNNDDASKPTVVNHGSFPLLQVELVNETNTNFPRNWLSQEKVDFLNQNSVHCENVVRKGKLLCIVLFCVSNQSNYYLFLHMGMTGEIRPPPPQSTTATCCTWGLGPQQDNQEEWSRFPPKYTYLILRAGNYCVAFSDARKFGKCELSSDCSSMDSLAPDAWLELQKEEQIQVVVPRIMGQSLGIKALLLDQRRAISGVGNWIADEVLYQIQMHPDQTNLTESQAANLLTCLQDIVSQAITCLEQQQPYPNHWLFHYRWTKGKATTTQDSRGRNISFLKSGGRTSAIILPQQKLQQQQKQQPKEKKPSTPVDQPNQHQESLEMPKKKNNNKKKRTRKTTTTTTSTTTTRQDHENPQVEEKTTTTPTTPNNTNNKKLRRSPRLVSP